MRWVHPSGEAHSQHGGVRRHAVRVAAVATGVLLVVYLLASTIVDLVASDHFVRTLDARLVARLGDLSRIVPAGTCPDGPILPSVEPQQGGGDLDDAPVLAWCIPGASSNAVALVANAPSLPAPARSVRAPTDMVIAGHDFRVAGRSDRNAVLVAATSRQALSSALSTLLATEGVLGPFVLLTFFLAATLIGLRAAAPVERARRQQLDFTADASHELRTPLSVIEAEVGLALGTPRQAPAYRDALERVGAESKRLRSIVDDLLWLARLEGLPSAPPREAVDLGAIVEISLRRMSAVAERAGVSLSATVDGLAIVLAPAEWLDRLVGVLLDNACRYAGNGGSVSVGLDTQGGRVVLAVEDSGPGIPAEERERVLRRFHRASASQGGAGLGLAIAKAVAEGTNGRLSIGEAVGGGARVAVSWPRMAPPRVGHVGRPRSS